MKKLIRAGAQVNEEGHGDLTPMWVAVSAGWADAVRLLLRAGADPNANFRGEPLLVHAAMGKPEIVDILLRSGADPRGMGTEGNALAALSPGHQDHAPEVARLLLNAGVSTSARDSRKRTAIDCLLARVTPKGRKLDRRVATAQLEVLRVLEPHAGKQRQLVTVSALELERRLGRSSKRAQTPGNVAVTDLQIRTALYEYGRKIAKGLNMSDVDVSKPASIRRAISEIWDETSYTYSESFEVVLNKLAPDLGAQWSKLKKRLKLHSEFNRGLTDGMKAKVAKVATSKPRRKDKPKAKIRS